MASGSRYATGPFSTLECAERAKRGRGKPVLIMDIELVFMPYLSNAVVSAKSLRCFSFPCSTEAVDIAHKPPCSL